MQKFGFKAFEKKGCCQTFLGQTVALKVTNLADDYWFRLLARIKSIAVSNGVLPRLPWEQVIWGKDHIADLPTATQVPLDLIAANNNAREACIDLFPRQLELALAEMITQLRKHEHVLLSLCNDFVQEIAFLTQRAESMMEQKFRADVLHQMHRAADQEVSVEKAVKYLRGAKLSGLYACMDSKFKVEVDNILSFLCMVNEGNGPKDISSFTSPFLEAVVEQAKNVYQVKVMNSSASSGHLFQHKVLVGSEAARHDLSCFREALQAEGGDIGPFAANLRRFAWLISPHEQSEVEQAVTERVKRRRTELMSPLAITDAQAAKDREEGDTAKAASSSADDVLMADGDLFDQPLPKGVSAAAKQAKASKAQSSGEPSKDDVKANLRALFTPKIT